ncbi:MAG: hypothetical protein OXI64_07230 [Defluviicoccus sp.]|nr:hypothetical protein [Defluviicoccus sp.]
MAPLSERLTQALSADPTVLRIDARRLRGEEMRRMASALKRRIAAAAAVLAGRRAAGRLIGTSRFRSVP